MYPLSFFCTRNKNHVPDELKRLEKLPQGLRKANACGGGVRPEQRTLFVEATSNEAGNLTREGGNPLGLPMGRMSISMLKCSRHSVPLSWGNVPILPRSMSRFCGT